MAANSELATAVGAANITTTSATNTTSIFEDALLSDRCLGTTGILAERLEREGARVELALDTPQ
ncbi:MAG TPA: hypothetical protein VHE14_00170 [Solirubrobacteraceae bacterium]|nr:hypothetical protein [Solirubrobacteraceae bacterium]